MNLSKWYLIILLSLLLPAQAFAAGYLVKFSGVPVSQAENIKKAFPFVFERSATLQEIDEVIRFLMKSGLYSGIDAVRREGREDEIVLVATVIRKISDVRISGNKDFSSSEIVRVLKIEKGDMFQRKNLLASADELRELYGRRGFLAAKIEIDFKLEGDSQVAVLVSVNEGRRTQISSVTVESANPELNKVVQRKARKLAKVPFSDENVQEFQKNITEYLQDERFLTARLSEPAIEYNADRSEVKMTYTIEQPWEFKFIFSGSMSYSDGRLVRELGINNYGTTSTNPTPDLTEKLRKFYQDQGYANVEVKGTQKFIAQKYQQEVQFDIVEHPRVRIGKINIVGNHSRPDEYYVDLITEGGSDLMRDGYFNRRDVEEAGKTMLIDLQNEGFLRSKVQATRLEYNDDKSSVRIFVELDEGPRTIVNQIKFTGAHKIPVSELEKVVDLKMGGPLGLRELDQSIQSIKDYYRQRGYLEVAIANEGEGIIAYNESSTQATIEYIIKEGPQVKVAQILIEGEKLTREEVIRRELSFKPGDVLTPETVDDSIFHLQQLGLFGFVRVRTLEENTAISERTVIVEVSERDPGLFTSGIGITKDFDITYRGYLGVAYRNILGTGRAVSLRADPSYSSDPRISYLENRIAASYLEPYMFRDHTKGRVNVVREQSFFDFDHDSGHAIIQEENTLGLLLERDFSRHFKLTYTAYSISEQSKFDRSSYQSLERQNIAKVGPLLELDYRNDVFDPTRGTYSFINFEYSDPIIGSSQDRVETIQFAKTTASSTYYMPLTKSNRWVWANSARGGLVSQLSDKKPSGVPAQEIFFLGGRSTIRGFEPSDLERIPNTRQLGVTNLRDFRLKGESTFYLFKSEIRFPLWGTSPMGSLFGAIFYDGGAVLIDQPGVVIEDAYRDSVGFALRISTPVGPVSFDFGFKLDRKEYIDKTTNETVRESPWAFHFSIGAF